MAHYQQQRFVEIVRSHYPDFFTGRKILEVGSWNVNETVRRFFTDCGYVGADIAEGRGVDVVCPGQDLAFSDAEFDLVISGECFEHNPQWVATFTNMHRMLKPGGLCLITCASIGRREHGTQRKAPNTSLTAQSGHDDYYRNLSKRDFLKNFPLDQMFQAREMFYNVYCDDFYFIGIKAGGPGVKTIPTALKSEVCQIKEPQSPGAARVLYKTALFWTTFAWASLVGEDSYHALRFHISRRLKLLRSLRPRAVKK